jgi:putative DNA primase/helicase
MASPEVPAGTNVAAWEALGAERVSNGWRIPERDGSGAIIGWNRRGDDGSKKAEPGGKRGLIMPPTLRDDAGSNRDPILVCEGASDTAAALSFGFDAVGVPMAGQGGEMLAEWLQGRHVVIVGDGDEAGRRGVAKLTEALQGAAQSVRSCYPPKGFKDLRTWVVDGAADRREIEELIASISSKPRSAVLVRLSEVEPKPVSWLWPGRFALGKLALIAGDPGLGKSFLSLDIAARVSCGTVWPDGRKPQPAGGVVLLNAEDDAEDTIAPRLISAGADLSRVVVLSGVRHPVNAEGAVAERHLDLSADLPALEEAIDAVGECRLVVVDPISAYLGRTDSHNNAELRGVLAPLSALAARKSVALVVVTHLNKASGGPAIYRATGSIAFTGAARAVWSVSRDKNDPRRRLFLPVKNNLAHDEGGLAYEIGNTGVDGGPALAWEVGAVEQTADEALGSGDGPKPGTKLADAVEWLRHRLAGAGAVPSLTVYSEGEKAGHSRRTVRRAMEELEVVSRPIAGVGSEHVWELTPFSESAKPLPLAKSGTVWPTDEIETVEGIPV